VEAIDGDPVFSIKSIIGAISDFPLIEQTHAFNSKIETLLGDLVRPPHSERIFYVYAQLDCFIERVVSPLRYGTLIPRFK
jgi:hypothetical protein